MGENRGLYGIMLDLLKLHATERQFVFGNLPFHPGIIIVSMQVRERVMLVTSVILWYMIIKRS